MSGAPYFPNPERDATLDGVELVCEECGDDLACEGYRLCSDCLEEVCR